MKNLPKVCKDQHTRLNVAHGAAHATEEKISIAKMRRNEVICFSDHMNEYKRTENVKIITIWKLTGTLHTQKKKSHLSGLP